MTDSTRHRLSLLLAIAGTLAMMAHSWTHTMITPAKRITLPTFERPAPDVREWPKHQYLPIG